MKSRHGWVRSTSRSGMVGARLGGPFMEVGVSQASCRVRSEKALWPTSGFSNGLGWENRHHWINIL